MTTVLFLMFLCGAGVLLLTTTTCCRRLGMSIRPTTNPPRKPPKAGRRRSWTMVSRYRVSWWTTYEKYGVLSKLGSFLVEKQAEICSVRKDFAVKLQYVETGYPHRGNTASERC
jgi:hypothetical protein